MHAGALFELRSGGTLKSGQEPFGVQEQPRAAQKLPRVPQEWPSGRQRAARKQPRGREEQKEAPKKKKRVSKAKSLSLPLRVKSWVAFSGRLACVFACTQVFCSSLFRRATLRAAKSRSGFKSSQELPKSGQERPKSGRAAAKEPPRRSQEAAKRPRRAERGTQEEKNASAKQRV